MNKKQVIQYFGNQMNLARELGITQSAISQWGVRVPLNTAVLIEWITDGGLQVDLSQYADKNSKAARKLKQQTRAGGTY